MGRLSFPHFFDMVSQSPQLYDFKILHWQLGAVREITLNTDGCSKGNLGICGGGSVLRNSSGGFVLAFSAFLRDYSSLHTEAMVVRLSLQLCIQRGFAQVFVQFDSLALIDILRGKFCCPWKIRGEVTQICQMVGNVSSFLHCYKETNKVADILSNVVVSYPQDNIRIYESLMTLPLLARGEARFNKVGVPSIRRIRLG